MSTRMIFIVTAPNDNVRGVIITVYSGCVCIYCCKTMRCCTGKVYKVYTVKSQIKYHVNHIIMLHVYGDTCFPLIMKYPIKLSFSDTIGFYEMPFFQLTQLLVCTSKYFSN